MRTASLLLALLVVVGCGSGSGKTVPVTGTVLKGGKAYTFEAKSLPPGDPGFRMMFIKIEASGAAGETSSAKFNPADGTFEVKGSKGTGLAPGKYRVTVEKGAMGTADELKNAFKGEKSPLTAEVPDAPSVKLEVDLDGKAVRAK